LVLTPVFYVLVRKLSERRLPVAHVEPKVVASEVLADG